VMPRISALMSECNSETLQDRSREDTLRCLEYPHSCPNATS